MEKEGVVDRGSRGGHETTVGTVTRWAVQNTCSEQSEQPQLKRCSMIAGCSATRGLSRCCTGTTVILGRGSCGSSLQGVLVLVENKILSFVTRLPARHGTVYRHIVLCILYCAWWSRLVATENYEA